jgi:hypothetical protein
VLPCHTDAHRRTRSYARITRAHRQTDTHTHTHTHTHTVGPIEIEPLERLAQEDARAGVYMRAREHVICVCVCMCSMCTSVYVYVYECLIQEPTSRYMRGTELVILLTPVHMITPRVC